MKTSIFTILLVLLIGCKENTVETQTEQPKSIITNNIETPRGQIVLIYRGKTEPSNPLPNGHRVDNWCIRNDATVPIDSVKIHEVNTDSTINMGFYDIPPFTMQPQDSVTISVMDCITISLNWERP